LRGSIRRSQLLDAGDKQNQIGCGGRFGFGHGYGAVSIGGEADWGNSFVVGIRVGSIYRKIFAQFDDMFSSTRPYRLRNQKDDSPESGRKAENKDLVVHR
jgi:hypothetical protein